MLRLAQEEAVGLQHPFIGTEHLLLGLARQADSVGGIALRNLGADPTAVRSAVESIIGRGDERVTREVGLTPRAKKVIQLGVDEARRLKHHYIGTEHLLLGLVREGEGVAAGVLESVGVDLERVRTEVRRVLVSMALRRSVLDSDTMVVLPSVEARITPGSTASTLGPPSFTAGLSLGISLSTEVRALLVRAFAEAQRRGDPTVTPAHLLLELVQPGEPTAAAFASAGIDPERIAAVAETLLHDQPDSAAPLDPRIEADDQPEV